MAETKLNIYQKLVEVRKAVPYLKKDNKGHQFQYVSSSQTLGQLKGKMDDLGLLLVPRVVSSKVSDHTTAKGNHEYFTELGVEFTWINAENPEQQITSIWYGQGLDSGEKGVGKALTYAEKYFMLKFFNIATDKDDPDSFQKKYDKSPAQPERSEDERFSAAIDWITNHAKKQCTVAEFDAAIYNARQKLNSFTGKMKKDIESTIEDTRATIGGEDE